MIDRLAKSPRTAGVRLLAVLLLAIAGCGKSDDGKTGSTQSGEVVQKLTTVKLRVSVAELQEFLKDEKNKNLRLLDVRSKKDYDQAHIPGAVHVELSAWKSLALKDDGKGLTDKAAWETEMRKLGINNLTEIIVYAENPTSATRIWWTLKYLGVERAGILDGGWNPRRRSKATSKSSSTSIGSRSSAI